MLHKSKSHISNTNFPFKTRYFLGVMGLTTYPTQRTTIPLVDIWTCRVHTYCMYSIYTFLYSIHTILCNIFIHFSCNKNVGDSHPWRFGMVHSERTGVVLMHKHFSSRLNTFCNSVSTVTNCTCYYEGI